MGVGGASEGCCDGLGATKTGMEWAFLTIDDDDACFGYNFVSSYLLSFSLLIVAWWGVLLSLPRRASTCLPFSPFSFPWPHDMTGRTRPSLLGWNLGGHFTSDTNHEDDVTGGWGVMLLGE